MGPRGAECQLALTHGVWDADGQPCVRVDAHGRRVYVFYVCVLWWGTRIQ